MSKPQIVSKKVKKVIQGGLEKTSLLEQPGQSTEGLGGGVFFFHLPLSSPYPEEHTSH